MSGLCPETVIVSSQAADLQVGIDGGGESAGQLDPFAFDGAEADQRERDRVGARAQDR